MTPQLFIGEHSQSQENPTKQKQSFCTVMVSVDDTMFSLCTEDHQTDDDCREHGGGQGETGWVQGGAGILGYRSLQHNGETAGHSGGLGASLPSLGALNAHYAV